MLNELKQNWQKYYITILLLVILLFAVLTKSWRLYYPQTHMFDEVYVGFTAEEYVKGNLSAWVWDDPAPQGFAYDWSHPPMGRLIMTPVIRVLGISSFSRRVVPMLAGVLITLMVFLLAKLLFPKKPAIWLMAAWLSTLEGLLLTMSRIGLADTMLVLFLMTSIYFLWQKKFWFSSFFFGLAVSTKWTSVYLLGYIGIVLLTYFPWKKNLVQVVKNLTKAFIIGLLYLTMGVLFYVISYLPLIIHYGFTKFIALQKQMFWYHTGLVANHPWQSPAISWPMLLRPVWFWVEYSGDMVSNIFALGNPLIFWGGLIAVIFTLFYTILNKNIKLYYLLLAYGVFWLPWIFSPRIMFLYHYLPAIPFLCIILAFALEFAAQLHKIAKTLVVLYLVAILGVFWFFYPYLTGIPVLKDSLDKFYWLSTWKP